MDLPGIERARTAKEEPALAFKTFDGNAHTEGRRISSILVRRFL